MPSLFNSLIAATVLASASAAFNAAGSTNVITYWGQGANQQRLVETCKNPYIDVINLGFVDVFPDQGPGDWPGTNFGNACWGDVYENDGVNTTLLKTCPNLADDITTCQELYGKKILLSIGGGSPNTYYIDDDASGKSFADFLWGAFGPSSANSGQPRPFGDASVDGFDFDIESVISPAPKDSDGNAIAYETSGYGAMINHLHDDLYPEDTSKSYYISGAPQCTLPDSHYTTVMANAWFDFMWIQFYNTPGCSARDGVNHINGEGTTDISFSAWEDSTSLNPDVLYYIGLPAAEAASSDASYYLTPAEVNQLAQRFINDNAFGGMMLWEATYNANNTICGSDYASWVKQLLTAATSGAFIDTDPSHCATPTTSSAISTPTPTVLTITPDGSCGGNTTFTCEGSNFGQCCSLYGYCGGTADYCDDNCDASDFFQCPELFNFFEPNFFSGYCKLDSKLDLELGQEFDPKLDKLNSLDQPDTILSLSQQQCQHAQQQCQRVGGQLGEQRFLGFGLLHSQSLDLESTRVCVLDLIFELLELLVSVDFKRVGKLITIDQLSRVKHFRQHLIECVSIQLGNFEFRKRFSKLDKIVQFCRIKLVSVNFKRVSKLITINQLSRVKHVRQPVIECVSVQLSNFDFRKRFSKLDNIVHFCHIKLIRQRDIECNLYDICARISYTHKRDTVHNLHKSLH
ncbi:hypothetical protein LTR08_007771 [Meristemomyces frigidus]|nr:hypothetical protein LTR08_007771 [Meristemomyces frigidus]